MDLIAIALINRLLQIGVIAPDDLAAMADELEREGDEDAAHEVLCCITALAPPDKPSLSVISGGKESDD